MDFLDSVEKPGRYAGGELHSIQKSDADMHFALCFPDIYEIGMSNLAIQLLYELMNAQDKVYVERAFMPWKDMAERLRESGSRLASLETERPLSDFAMVGFSLAYEMSASNVLAMLDLGGIPLLSEERGEQDPVVVGGGQCTVNPEPLADVFDLFIIGEGEEVNLELCSAFLESRKLGEDRDAFLKRAAQIDGIYVPKFYQPVYAGDGTIDRIESEADVPPRIRRRFVRDLNAAPMLSKPIVPYTEVVHDRCVLEIMRGCANGCRFCQAGYATRPVRERSAKNCLKMAQDITDATGYEEIALCSLSSGDYSEILPLMEDLLSTYKDRHIGLSMPSLRMDSFRFAQQIQEVRKKGLTFAPEAGTQRLRDVINKNITEEDVLGAAKTAFESGATHVKLYFMIGLPTETYEDLDGIADLVARVREQFYAVPKEKRKGRLEIAVSVSNFVPKAVTPFQWEGQCAVDELERRQQYLREKLRMRGVKFSYHDAKLSHLEAVLAKGDRRLGKALRRAYEKGAMLDAWREEFRPELYEQAFAETGIDPEWYAGRKRSTDETLPWSHIDAGISQEFLKRELERAYMEKTTGACSTDCRGCGLQSAGCGMHEPKSA